MSTTLTRRGFAGLLALALIATGPAATALADGGDGYQARKGMQFVPKGGAVKAGKPAKLRDGVGRKRASPREWFDRDANGNPVTGVRRSRITGRYTVSRYGRDPRNGRIVPVWVRTYSAKEWEKMTTYDGDSDTTTITIPRGGNRTRTVQVDGNATGA